MCPPAYGMEVDYKVSVAEVTELHNILSFRQKRFFIVIFPSVYIVTAYLYVCADILIVIYKKMEKKILK